MFQDFILLRQSCARIPRYFSPMPLVFRILEGRALEFLQPPYAFPASCRARATHCQRRKHERPNGNTNSKPMNLACVFPLCLRSPLAERISAASVSFACLQGGDVNHVTPYFPPRDIRRIVSGTTMQFDIAKKDKQPNVSSAARELRTSSGCPSTWPNNGLCEKHSGASDENPRYWRKPDQIWSIVGSSSAETSHSQVFWAKARQRQVTDLDVTVLRFSGPGLPSPRQMLCGDAPRLFSYHFSVHLSSVLACTQSCSTQQFNCLVLGQHVQSAQVVSFWGQDKPQTTLNAIDKQERQCWPSKPGIFL